MSLEREIKFTIKRFDEIKKRVSVNEEHIKRLYDRVDSIIEDFADIKQSLKNIEYAIKLLTWAKKEAGDR